MRYYLEIKKTLPANQDRGAVTEWRRSRYRNGTPITFPDLDVAKRTADTLPHFNGTARVVDDAGMVHHEASPA